MRYFPPKGGFLRQDLQTAALAAGQQHGDYTFFLKIHGHSSSSE